MEPALKVLKLAGFMVAASYRIQSNRSQRQSEVQFSGQKHCSSGYYQHKLGIARKPWCVCMNENYWKKRQFLLFVQLSYAQSAEFEARYQILVKRTPGRPPGTPSERTWQEFGKCST